MHTILTLIRKDFALLRRDRASLILTFAVPLVLIYVFGQIFTPRSNGAPPAGIPLAVVNAGGGPAADRLLAALRAEPVFRVVTTIETADHASRPLTEEDVRRQMRDNVYRFALVLPADMAGGDQLGLHLKILSNPRNEFETQLVNGVLQKTIFSNVPQLLGLSLQARARSYLGEERLGQFNQSVAGAVARAFGGDPAEIERKISAGDFGFSELASTGGTGGGGSSDGLFARIVRIESEQVVGKEVKSPMATRSIGGWAMQFLLFALTASATSLFHEKEQGLLQRLLSSPATRAHLLWSKFLYGVFLGLFQLLVLFFAGRLMYGVEVERHLPLLALVCVVAAAACTSFGMLLAAVSPSPEAARGLGTLLILLMSAIGGAWFPVSMMPEFLQQLGKLTLVYWAMEGFQQVLWAEAGFMRVLPTIGVLAAMAAGVLALAMWRFNRSRIFG